VGVINLKYIQKRIKKTVMLLVFMSSFLLTQKSEAQIIYESISLGFSNWWRVYDSPNEKVALLNPDFSNGEPYLLPLATLQGRIKLTNHLGLNTRVGYGEKVYQSSLQLAQLTIKETLLHTMIPASLSLDISTPHYGIQEENILFKKFRFKAGFGLNRYFVLHKIDREVNFGTGSFSKVYYNGNNYGWAALIGVEKNLKAFSLGLEARYNQGQFYQKIYLEDNPDQMIRQRIAATGVELGLYISYYFRNHREIRNQLNHKTLMENERKKQTEN
jgi:hypothetical protein